jgi:hypothetical protein
MSSALAPRLARALAIAKTYKDIFRFQPESKPGWKRVRFQPTFQQGQK